MGILSPSRIISIKAPAKINLYLKVFNQRKDGYHNLCSLMQMVGLYDHLTFQEAPSGIRLNVENSHLPSGHENLIVQAVELFLQEMETANKGGGKKGLRMTLRKNIPVSAGLGGGSSDAAATLIGLNRLWSLHWPWKKLAKIGERLGSDLPFFFSGPTAWATGRGEKIENRASVFDGWAVLVNPGQAVSTASVFREFSKTFVLTKKKPDINIGAPVFQKPTIERVFHKPYNDLEKITQKRLPALQAIKKRLKALGGEPVMMSGSGPTLFALFAGHETAAQAARVLGNQASLKVWVAKILKHSPF